MYFDAISKKEAMKLAEVELKLSRANLQTYAIRATASGTLAVIEKRPGEAVRAWETVVEIDVPEK